MIKEVWKDIIGFEGYYQISNLGNVKSLERFVPRKVKERFLKPRIKKDYYYVKLSKNGFSKHYPIYRLVAIAFIPNPNNKPCIDHINGCKKDNSVYNLRWVTHKENTNNPSTNITKPVLCIETNTVYPSVCEAAKHFNLHQSNISSACIKNRKSGGYHWKYLEV